MIKLIREVGRYFGKKSARKDSNSYFFPVPLDESSALCMCLESSFNGRPLADYHSEAQLLLSRARVRSARKQRKEQLAWHEEDSSFSGTLCHPLWRMIDDFNVAKAIGYAETSRINAEALRDKHVGKTGVAA